ncbi:hypothetical protein P7K49_002514 [Saguinus oedipus]|uniref:C2H2-type domain-containing protein n=1 Tax=Saguinus oedipus TaxID=9490 RepID=A0ABQ9WHJ2_SAGOE|nr:hypothetical protein P7K49_002514 [Saguinus oedipus]
MAPPHWAPGLSNGHDLAAILAICDGSLAHLALVEGHLLIEEASPGCLNCKARWRTNDARKHHCESDQHPLCVKWVELFLASLAFGVKRKAASVGLGHCWASWEVAYCSLLSLGKSDIEERHRCESPIQGQLPQPPTVAPVISSPFSATFHGSRAVFFGKE